VRRDIATNGAKNNIASGKVQISPKQLMEKRARDTAESQLVERARKFPRPRRSVRDDEDGVR
jgi:hypothetical protein